MTIQPASDRSLLVSFGDEISIAAHHQVARLTHALEGQRGVLNLHPAFASVLIDFDPRFHSHADIEALARQRVQTATGEAREPRVVEIPVCYGGEFGPDLEYVARHAGLAPERVVELHAATDFHARSRRRRRGEKPAAAPRPVSIFPTAIPDLPGPAAPPPWVPPPASDSTIDESIWQTASAAEGPAAGEIVLEPGEAESFLVEVAPSETPAGEATPDFAAGWVAIRDANIRPYVDWVVPPPFTLPVATTARGGEAKPAQGGQNQSGQGGNDSGGGRRRHRHSRHGRNRHSRDGGDRRGPRLPGVYNPGGD